jgi:glycosyltransferase involved in cell wall biosynthesis
MCTLNGAQFLPAQLASLEQQTHANWRLIVSDDGSTDATLKILAHFAQRVPQDVEVRQGPRQGPSANFVSLTSDCDIVGDYFAFCDQDDIWLPDKLRHALNWIRNVPAATPAVYGGRTRLVSAAGVPFGRAPLFAKDPSFANALAQSIAGANTMVFNRATKSMVEQAGPLMVVSHDWWLYQLVTGSGGLVHYDPVPQVDYRQHPGNTIGCNRGVRAQLKRVLMVFQGGFSEWNEINLAALHEVRHILTGDARGLIDDYQAMRRGNLYQRVSAFVRSGIRRQTFLGNVALLTAIVLRKV